MESFVHSAGMAPISLLRLLSLAKMHEIMDVNFFSAAIILKTLLGKKVNHHRLQSVVLISSIHSNRGVKGQPIYCASKGAIDSFVRAMADELASKVRINSILPGAINTSMGGTILENAAILKNPIDAGYLLGLGQTEDIANMTAFLISDKAKWITGQNLTVDGGKTAHL